MEKLKETTKKIILDNLQIIDENNFVELYDKIISEYDYNEWKDVKDKFKKANVGEGMVGDVESKYYQTHRIKQIKCYNVGFGDCFLCKDGTDNGAKMLVDFGARKADNAVINNVAVELSKTVKKYLMLSHLHEDHYCGFRHVNATVIQHFNFDEIYIPNYITNNGLEFLGEVLLASNSTSLLEQVKALLKIPLLFPKYVSTDTKIFLLREGNRIYNSLCAFEVLLPQRQSISLILNPQTERIVRNFADDYRNLLGYTEEGEDFATIRGYSETLEKEFDDIIEKLLERKLAFNIITNERKLKKRFDEYHNSLSLAFDELFVENAQNVLFLGDAERNDVEYLADNNKLKEEYCFIKVQHHGTKSHFYHNLPFAKYYAISNGARRADREISGLYDHHYGKTGAFICTNNTNCEICRCRCICTANCNRATQCGFYPDYTVNIP